MGRRMKVDVPSLPRDGYAGSCGDPKEEPLTSPGGEERLPGEGGT